MITHKSMIDTQVRLVRAGDETVSEDRPAKEEKRKSQAQLTPVQRLQREKCRIFHRR